MNNFFENIKYGITKEKPIQKDLLLSIIVDVYLYQTELLNKEKLTSNSITKPYNNFDKIFYDYMLKTFKISKVANIKVEEVLLSVNKYSGIISQLA